MPHGAVITAALGWEHAVPHGAVITAALGWEHAVASLESGELYESSLESVEMSESSSDTAAAAAAVLWQQVPLLNRVTAVAAGEHHR